MTHSLFLVVRIGIYYKLKLVRIVENIELIRLLQVFHISGKIIWHMYLKIISLILVKWTNMKGIARVCVVKCIINLSVDWTHKMCQYFMILPFVWARFRWQWQWHEQRTKAMYTIFTLHMHTRLIQIQYNTIYIYFMCICV